MQKPGRETVQTGIITQKVVFSSSSIIRQVLPFARSTAVSDFVEVYTYDEVDTSQSIQH
jgi:hypothetical protein